MDINERVDRIETNYYNYLSELQVFSDAKTSTTFVHIGVFYIPND